MYKIGENEMVLCPYNRSHVVSKLRIQKHIIKCQDRHPETKLVTCFYNYTHKLRPEDVLKHYEICSQKIRMEEARYCQSSHCVSCNSSEINDKSACGSVKGEKTLSIRKTNSIKSNNIKDSNFKTSASQNQALRGVGKADDGDYLRPLNLPKTVSKAFTSAKQEGEKSSDMVPASESSLPQSRGTGRGKRFFLNSSKPTQINDHLLPNASDMENGCSKEIKAKPKYFLNSVSDMGNSCSASVISFFDDSTTLKSDNITFDAYDDDEDEDDDDGFIFKNFDKYVRI